MRDFFWRSLHHWLSATGVVLATLASVSFLSLLSLELAGHTTSNYTGLLSYVLLPALFVLGLVLIPIGLALLRKRERAGAQSRFPVLDFNDARLRGATLVVGLVTCLNLMLVATGTFKGLEVMHSDAFCGGTCHNVMEPEAVSHALSSHANVACADCHIGEGAGHFVKAKLRGATQALQFIVGDVSRPIPQPTIEVADAICLRCHAPQIARVDALHIHRTYSDDEVAIEKTTVFRMRVQNIHRHNKMKIRYLSDEARTTIAKVELGKETFSAKDTPANAQWHEMGCTDCHNRVAHRFASPAAIVDKAIERGDLTKATPFIKRDSVLALTAGTSPTLQAKWAQNNFPDMHVAWGTYRDFLQHEPGCFRCHDNEHQTAAGKSIPQKCTGACHDLLATEEEKPEIIDVLYP